MRKPTAKELYEIRESFGCDIDYARRIHIKRQISEELRDPEVDLREILMWITRELL